LDAVAEADDRTRRDVPTAAALKRSPPVRHAPQLAMTRPVSLIAGVEPRSRSRPSERRGSHIPDACVGRPASAPSRPARRLLASPWRGSRQRWPVWRGRCSSVSVRRARVKRWTGAMWLLQLGDRCGGARARWRSFGHADVLAPSRHSPLSSRRLSAVRYWARPRRSRRCCWTPAARKRDTKLNSAPRSAADHSWSCTTCCSSPRTRRAPAGAPARAAPRRGSRPSASELTRALDGLTGTLAVPSLRRAVATRQPP
jgi:hypothetical protein